MDVHLQTVPQYVVGITFTHAASNHPLRYTSSPFISIARFLVILRCKTIHGTIIETACPCLSGQVLYHDHVKPTLYYVLHISSCHHRITVWSWSESVALQRLHDHDLRQAEREFSARMPHPRKGVMKMNAGSCRF